MPPAAPAARRVPVAALVLAVLLAVISTGLPAGASAELDRPTDEPVRPEEGEIIRLYRSALGRNPDLGGFHYWVGRRVEGVPLGVVADSFLVGPEFQRRFGHGDDRAFVERVYTNVLGRSGEDEGVAYWLGELAAGLDRHHLVLLFSESTELRRITGTTPVELPPWRPVVGTVTAGELGPSWREGCPVGPDDLRKVEVDHVDQTGGHSRGTLVVHRDVVDEVTGIFARLYQARFPITSIRPVAEFAVADGPAADPEQVAAELDLASMAADNTSGFNCRRVTGGTRWSRHAQGRAIDINPVANPYVSGDGATVLPATGAPWRDRSAYHPTMIRPGDVVTRAFAEAGWRWGGDFTTVADYHHFDR